MGAGTPWKNLDAEKENKKEKKRQKLKKSKTKGEKEKMVDEIMNYLLSTEALRAPMKNWSCEKQSAN